MAVLLTARDSEDVSRLRVPVRSMARGKPVVGRLRVHRKTAEQERTGRASGLDMFPVR